MQRIAVIFGFTDTLPGWERGVVVSLATILLIVPPVVVEFYPLSSFPMFSDDPLTRVFSTASDESGASIPLPSIGIIDLYLGNPNPIVNIKPQRPTDAAYRFWTTEEFAPFIQEALRTKKGAEPILFTQELVGAKPDGVFMRIGVIDKRSWSITTTEIHPVDK